MPKKTRKYKTKKKTTTKEGKTEYQRKYMRDYRKGKKSQLEKLKKEFPDVYKYVFG